MNVDGWELVTKETKIFGGQRIHMGWPNCNTYLVSLADYDKEKKECRFALVTNPEQPGSMMYTAEEGKFIFFQEEIIEMCLKWKNTTIHQGPKRS